MARWLAIETTAGACSVALFEGDVLIAEAHEQVSRGHAERLLPMIAALPDGGRADEILVDCGPGSFTGVRVGVAAARALAFGWSVPVHGASSLAIVAARAFADDGELRTLAVALEGGHGQLFVQSFARGGEAMSPLQSLAPEGAARVASAAIVAGSGAARLVTARGSGEVREIVLAARDMALLPEPARLLPPVPIYGRGPMPDPWPDAVTVSVAPASADDLGTVIAIMSEAFDPAFGEAWTLPQCASMLDMPGSMLFLGLVEGRAAGFALARAAAGEAELLLLGVRPRDRRQGIGRALLDHIVTAARQKDAISLHLEVRSGNPAIGLYVSNGFDKIGSRQRYYRGNDGRFHDAETYRRILA